MDFVKEHVLELILVVAGLGVVGFGIYSITHKDAQRGKYTAFTDESVTKYLKTKGLYEVLAGCGFVLEGIGGLGIIPMQWSSCGRILFCASAISNVLALKKLIKK